MYTLTRTLLLLAAGLLLAASTTAAAEHSPALDDMIAAAGPGEAIRVILFLDGRVEMDDVYPVARSLPMDARRNYVVTTLKGRFHDMSGRVMERLALAQKSGDVTVLRPLWIVNAIRVHLVPSLLREIEENYPEVIFIAADTPFENTLDQVGWGVADMQAVRVWSEFGADGSGVIVGHKDSGVDYNHAGFAGHLWVNPGEDLNQNGLVDPSDWNGVDDDGNGYVDDLRGWDFDNDNAEVYDAVGHGTSTASVVSANFAPCDTVSVAPGAKLMILSAYRYQGPVWEASQYAIEMGAHVITASVSFKHSDCNDTGVRECPNYVAHRMVSEMELAAGLLHTNSTGNAGTSNPVPFSAAAPSNCPPPANTPQQPISGGVSSVIGVAAYNMGGQLETASGHGPSAWSRADICVHPRMPFCGEAGRSNEYPPAFEDYPYQQGLSAGLIKPDFAGPTVVTSLGRGGGCSSIGGTSGATPHVAGACALIMSRFPGITPEETYLLLVNHALDAGAPGLDTLWGYGKIRPYPACAAGVAGRALVHGTVTGSGNPLAGARVFTDSSMSVFSDTHGSFQLSLAPGEHVIRCRAWGYAETRDTVTITAGSDLQHNISLSSVTQAPFQGTVFGNGQPLPQIRVWIPEYNLEATTGNDGRFSIPLFVGEYIVHAGNLPWEEIAFAYTHLAVPEDYPITLERSPQAYPCGPDHYGYFIYDEYDTPHLVFDWVEIDPGMGGLPGQQLSVGNDATVAMTLPFTFRFYGSDFTAITVSANGFIIVGATSSFEWSAFPIPSPWAPNGYLAPWFYDWQPQTGGGVYYYAQPDSHRVIVEWSNVPEYDGRGTATFQAILFDPQFVPSPSGDGVVKYQYLETEGPFEGSIGIENLSGTDGIEYRYLTFYDVHATPISPGSALLVTTDSALAVEPGIAPLRPLEFSLLPNYPNPFNPLTTFVWSVPREMRVRLALYDLLGREAAVVFDGISAAGEHHQSFDARDLATGMYFARLTSTENSAVRKVLLLR